MAALALGKIQEAEVGPERSPLPVPAICSGPRPSTLTEAVCVLPTQQAAIEKLTSRFPDSPRVDVLHGMQLEASGRQHDAVLVYQNILASDETNIVRPLRDCLPSFGSGADLLL
jgi:hypothetical protein